ncbi:hypothetical protein HF325_001545 [Metschnikowia pulcherrima]|uniref:GAF domain-containing protein n=1 Tax=Metschnikowia pulcherrima TaxID=27326 RepID=A0A8H7GWA3_9ASCO|nr:hypothetical protein HF325_001545 [Metschnikowia pulcherrima]
MGFEKSAVKSHLLPNYLEENYGLVPVTISQFLDAYSKGDQNLSDMQCPNCLKVSGFMAPPDCYREQMRTVAVERYLRLEHWKNRLIFHIITAEVRRAIGTYGVSVSLIHKNTAYVKYETKLEFKELPRVVLLDAHAILSKGGFVLKDAAEDWRTSQNPLVTGPPTIRFYAGVSLLTLGGIPVGVLAIFSTLPKLSFSSKKMRLLTKIAAHLMNLLDTPFENMELCDEKTLPENPNAGDVELAELISKLGRATSSGGHMTIFERDGLGLCYSHSHIFKLSHYEEHQLVTDSVMADTQKQEIRLLLRRVRSLKSACKIITKLIAAHHHFDCVVIVEIRFMEKHKVARSSIPDMGKASQGIPQRLQKLMIANSKISSERCKVRVLALNITEHDVTNTDAKVWLEAFMSERGCEIIGAPATCVYNSGMIMPFYVSKPNFIRKARKSTGDDTIDIYLRSGGYLIGAFNKTSNRSYMTPSLILKVYDHVKIARMMYLNK